MAKLGLHARCIKEERGREPSVYGGPCQGSREPSLVGIWRLCSRRNHLRFCARLPQVQVLSKGIGAAKGLLGQTQRFQASCVVCGVLTAGSRSLSLTCEVDGI